MAYVVTVLFSVRPEAREQFRQAVVLNAALSLEREAGCKVFDVCEHPSNSQFFLYEVYENAQDFQVHLKAAHFLAFDKQAAPWVTAKQINTYERLGTIA